MTAIVLQGDARQLPLPDESVDLLVTSPPYFGLRSYTDAGEHYVGQIGSESTPQAWLEALWACTAEWCRVLKPGGSMFINLGDKYAAGHGGSSAMRNGGYGANLTQAVWEDADEIDRNAWVSAHKQSTPKVVIPGTRPKSLLGIPWRYAIGCMGQGTPYQRERYIASLTDDVLDGTITQDTFWQRVREFDAQPKQPGLGLILRAEIIWAKPNGLPESTKDRVRRAHEQVFHFTRQPRYYAAVDEIREPYPEATLKRYQQPYLHGGLKIKTDHAPDWVDDRVAPTRKVDANPLGKLPGSVWSIPSAPLQVPAHLGVDHFAAFPPALVRPLVLGWSPPGVCTDCGEGRRPVVDADYRVTAADINPASKRLQAAQGNNFANRSYDRALRTTTITGYACACPQPDAPTRPSVILDPFGGTGTTALVATTHGRVGITVDRSADYCRYAAWRVNDPGERARARDMPKPPPIPEGMEPLFTM